MTYKEVCEQTLKNLQACTSALANARDEMDEDLSPIIQVLVEVFACIKNKHENAYNKAMLEEFKTLNK